MNGAARTSAVWSDALLAAALFSIDPVGLGGVIVRSGPGPVRDRWLETLRALLPSGAPVRRVPVRIEDERLLGGLDLSASLAAGRPMLQRGVLADCDGGVAILAMAERMEDATGARIAAVLDAGEVVIERDGLTMRLPAAIGLVALDEGLDETERPPEALMDRLAFHLDLDMIGARAPADAGPSSEAVADASRRLSTMRPATAAVLEALCATAGQLALPSSRPALLALRAATAHAALAGRTDILAEDAAVAARLVLAPRALAAADATPDKAHGSPETPPIPPQDAADVADSEADQDPSTQDAEMMIEAIQAALPDGLLDQIRFEGRRARSTRSQGAGSSVKSARRGRPVGSRAGALLGGDRLNLPETLRAAAPWQALRRAAPGLTRIQVRREDFRIRRFVQRQEATTVFLVDASGSAAFQRLAEAKGAVELLLAKAYVSRNRVALVAFRNAGAELLLEPTRSLTRAKRSLAELPGGGGTPLAAGLEAGLQLAMAEKARDRTPLIVILTDGRANIGRDGAPGRGGAEADAMTAARKIREAGVGAVFIDTSARAQPDGDRFARAMGAVYAPLPYADAGAVSGLIDGLRAVRR